MKITYTHGKLARQTADVPDAVGLRLIREGAAVVASEAVSEPADDGDAEPEPESTPKPKPKSKEADNG